MENTTTKQQFEFYYNGIKYNGSNTVMEELVSAATEGYSSNYWGFSKRDEESVDEKFEKLSNEFIKRVDNETSSLYKEFLILLDEEDPEHNGQERSMLASNNYNIKLHMNIFLKNFIDENTEVEVIELEGGAKLLVADLFLTNSIEDFTNEIELSQKQITMFNRTSDLPRLTAMLGKGYNYSGIENKAQGFGWNTLQVKKRIESLINEKFDACLVNYYRDGSDYISYHSDDESNIGSVIASLSIGETRRFVVRNKSSKEKTEIELTSGKLVVMIDAQREYEHCVPKTARKIGDRLNFTFRQMK